MTVESIAESTGHMRHKIFPLLKTLETSGHIIRMVDGGQAQFKVAENVPGEFQMAPSPSAPAGISTKKSQVKTASAKVVSIKKSEKAADKPAINPVMPTAAAKSVETAAPVNARLKLLQAMSVSAKSQDDLVALVDDFDGLIKSLIDEGLVEKDNILNEFVFMLTPKAMAELPAEILAQAQAVTPITAPSKAAKTKKQAAKPTGKNSKAGVTELPKRKRGRPTREEAARRAEEEKRISLETPATAGQRTAAEPKAANKKSGAIRKTPDALVATAAKAPEATPASMANQKPAASAPVLPTDLTENGEMLLQLNRVLSKLVDDQVGNLRQQNEMRKAEALEIARSLKDLSVNLTQVGKNMLEISERLLNSVS
jgi:hypothetical protein